MGKYSKIPGVVLISLVFQLIIASSAGAAEWQQIQGNAQDIGVGADGSVWIVGTDKNKDGFSIFRWTGIGWEKTPGEVVNISVGSIDHVWVLNKKNQIYRRTGNKWQQIPGSARDIGVGSDGSVWVVSTDKTSGGYTIYQWNGIAWTKMPGGAVRIAVGSVDNVWVVTENEEIFHWVGNSWYRMPGSAKDIGVGADGSVWIIGTKVAKKGFGNNILTWAKNGWEEQSLLSGTRISIGNSDHIWMTDSRNNIWQLK